MTRHPTTNTTITQIETDCRLHTDRQTSRQRSLIKSQIIIVLEQSHIIKQCWWVAFKYGEISRGSGVAQGFKYKLFPYYYRELILKLKTLGTLLVSVACDWDDPQGSNTKNCGSFNIVKLQLPTADLHHQWGLCYTFSRVEMEAY